MEAQPSPALILDDPNRKMYAIKVIKKESLLKKSAYQQKQMVKEIQVQRELKHCGNTLKLHKIYESDRYLNMLMEFQEGGTLGDALEKRVKINEEEARLIMA